MPAAVKDPLHDSLELSALMMTCPLRPAVPVTISGAASAPLILTVFPEARFATEIVSEHEAVMLTSAFNCPAIRMPLWLVVEGSSNTKQSIDPEKPPLVVVMFCIRLVVEFVDATLAQIVAPSSLPRYCPKLMAALVVDVPMFPVARSSPMLPLGWHETGATIFPPTTIEVITLLVA